MSLFSSTSAPRRLTNVLLPSSRTSGNAASARSKDSFSAAIARANVLPFETSAARSSRRDGDRAGGARALHDEVGEGLLVAPELLHHAREVAERRAEVLEGLAAGSRSGRRTSPRIPEASPAVPCGSSGSSVLKSWSRSTALVVASVSRSAALVDLRRVVGPGVQRDVAVGDRRQGGHPHGRLGALVQRREVLVVDRDLDVGLVVLGQLDVRDLADREAADLDLVALHELVGVLEVDRVLGPAAGSEHEDADSQDRHDERSDGRGPSDRHSCPSLSNPWGEPILSHDLSLESRPTCRSGPDRSRPSRVKNSFSSVVQTAALSPLDTGFSRPVERQSNAEAFHRRKWRS